jgi:DAK2 domain fusion protein YloV
MVLFHDALRTHRDEINSLNVYPVPDGDTGTNMLMTQQAVRDELERLDESAGLAEVAAAVTRSSLMGARGNSGVILAQALRGFVGSLASSEVSDAMAMAVALDAGAAEANAAVAAPVGGTILDVLADGAEAAGWTAADGYELDAVAAAALDAARASLARTTGALADLRRAGVVDAGGRGALLFFDALLAAITGSGLSEPVGPMGPVGSEGQVAASDREEPGTLSFTYEVQYLVELPDSEASTVRQELAEIGDSVVVVGGGGTWRVHVHTDEPDAAAAVAERRGAVPSSLEVTDLEGEIDRCRAGQARGVQSSPEQTTALVAVAEGDGLERILSSLGAAIVRGGPGHNPSVGELLRAVESAPSTSVILLPNHPNVVPAARSAAGQSAKQVQVAPSSSIPQGVAAAAAFNPDESLQDNARDLDAAADACAWGEVALAERDADTPAGHVNAGDALAFARGEPVAVDADPIEAAVALLRRLIEPDHEIVTAFVGADLDADDEAALTKRLHEEYPSLEIEVHRGDQPGYPILIGVE